MQQITDSKVPLYQVRISTQEFDKIQALTGEMASRYTSVEDEDFLRAAPTYAHELPQSLRSQLVEFRLSEPAGLCLLQGYPVDDCAIGPTPHHWKDKPVPSPTLEADLFFFLCASLLGEPFGWSTQQDGYILHDILPIKGHEHEQMGSGSEDVLAWHTEDAFHPYRADYMGLMCLRNPDQVETTYASIDTIHLDAKLWEILFERRFIIRPDESHLEKNRSRSARDRAAPQELLQRGYARIARMNTQPEKLAILFGDPQSPYLRLDPFFMDCIEDDPQAMEALTTLTRAVNEQIVGLALQPGEVLLVDNYKVVHGRVSFAARYDGTDRWLRRLSITRDLRKSRDARISAASRLIF